MAENTNNEKYLVDIEHERLSFFTPVGEVKALNDVTFRMKEGEVLGIVGESGSGKTTVGLTLLRLHQPTGGKALFDGKDLPYARTISLFW